MVSTSSYIIHLDMEAKNFLISIFLFFIFIVISIFVLFWLFLSYSRGYFSTPYRIIAASRFPVRSVFFQKITSFFQKYLNFFQNKVHISVFRLSFFKNFELF